MRATRIMERLGRSGRAAFGMALLQIACAQTLPAAPGPATPARPTEAITLAGCVTRECHSNIKAYEVLHGPVVADTCDACHRLTSAEDHTFQLMREKAELCTFCHEFDTGMLPVVHKPVMSGECLGCHNPHGGGDRTLTREATIERMCARCHESMTEGKRFLHTPVEQGQCNSCHRSHASKYPKLLDAVGPNLCLTCHQDFGTQMAKVKFTHKALDEGCGKCHEAHGSAFPMGLRESLADLCLSCHASIEEGTMGAYRHPATIGERACLTCHTAHGGDLAGLLFDLPVRICMTCHDKDIKTDGGKVVGSMARLLDPERVKHTPIREGHCGGCHSTHGGDQPVLLRRENSDKLYEQFTPERYDLCFGCHDKRLAESEKTDGLTNFRNGERNLHFVHVADSQPEGQPGRSCGVCHGPHTGKFEPLIRDSVMYGEWRLPIQYKKTASGGFCLSGCHAEFRYDRINPLPSKTVAMPAEMFLAVPPADKRKPVMAGWSGRDTKGNSVTIPDGDKPVILLFLRDDAALNGEVVKLAAAAVRGNADAGVVAVFDGKAADEKGREFAAEIPEGWRVVADADGGLSAAMGVEVRPASIVVQSDGVVVAHMSGWSPSLTRELGAYLDLAARKIGREDLDRRLAQSELVGDGPAKRAVWYLQMGRTLRDEGQPEKARATLTDGLKIKPDSMELRVELVRTLAELKDTATAENLMQQLPAGALPDWEEDLLRGRMLASRGEWDQAQELAEKILREKPDLAGAHFLMGMIYEHHQQWEKAAEAYRAAYAGKRP